MKIPRISLITLGVADLERATAFYAAILATPPNRSYEGVIFIELPGTWLALYPRDKLSEDISPDITARSTGFSGITLAHNARSREEVEAVMKRVEAAGGRIVKKARETFWGGYSGYFADPDGYHWEVAWGPMFDFGEDGSLRFRQT